MLRFQEKADTHFYGGSYVLQKVVIYPVEHQHCTETYRRLNLPITEHMVCAQGSHRDTCQVGAILLIRGFIVLNRRFNRQGWCRSRVTRAGH